MSTPLEMTGWIMKEHGIPDSKLTVLYKDAASVGTGRVRWICRCECGVEKSYDGSKVKNGKIKSCGCEKGGKLNNILGWVMKEHGIPDSKLTVIKRIPNYTKNHNLKDTHAYWLCQCECGNQIICNSASIIHGTTLSCGCLNKEITHELFSLDLTNQTFGYWTVIDFAYTKNGHTYWNCKCKCGKQKIIRGTYLFEGRSSSCGCKKITKGEEKIFSLLKANNIPFETQKIFNDLKNNNRYYRFDFFIDNRFLLEYDGEQHFQCTGYGWNTQENLKETQARDKIKNEYCYKNNIPLKRIPYWKLNTLTIEDIMGDEFLI